MIAPKLSAEKYLVLSTIDSTAFNDVGNSYIREFVKNGATFVDYEDGYIKKGLRKFQEFIFETIAKKSIEVVIYQADSIDFRFSLDFFAALKKKTFVVMLVGDSELFFDLRDLYYAQNVDLVAVFEYSPRFRFEQYGIKAISFHGAYDQNKYFKNPNIPKIFDVSFVGSVENYKARRDCLEYLLCKGIQSEIFGLGTKNGVVSLDKMISIFNQTKVNLNFSGIANRSILAPKPDIDYRLRQIKGRMAEIALCGGFVLTEYAPGLEEAFRIGHEIEVFHSKEQLFEKATYFLKNEEARETIAQQGFQRALKDYEVSRAIPNLITRIELERKNKIPSPMLGVYADKHFVTFYCTYRINMFAKLLKAGNWKGAVEELKVLFKIRQINLYLGLNYLLTILFPGLKKYLNRFKSSAKPF